MPAWLQTIDEQGLRWIAENLRISALDRAVCLFSSLGNAGLIFILLALGMLCVRRCRRAGAAALTALACGAAVTNLTVKPLLARPRPWVVMQGFETLLRSLDPNSFPSGHTCAAFAFAVALWPFLPKKWEKAAVLCAAVLMGYSRLYAGVHFPSDVLAGALIGTAAGLFAQWVLPRVQARLRRGR